MRGLLRAVTLAQMQQSIKTGGSQSQVVFGRPRHANAVPQRDISTIQSVNAGRPMPRFAQHNGALAGQPMHTTGIPQEMGTRRHSRHLTWIRDASQDGKRQGDLQSIDHTGTDGSDTSESQIESQGHRGPWFRRAGQQALSGVKPVLRNSIAAAEKQDLGLRGNVGPVGQSMAFTPMERERFSGSAAAPVTPAPFTSPPEQRLKHVQVTRATPSPATALLNLSGDFDLHPPVPALSHVKALPERRQDQLTGISGQAPPPVAVQADTASRNIGDKGIEQMSTDECVIQGERIEGATSKEGTCMAMCPEDERTRRTESGPHKLEIRPGLPAENTMIKDLERDPPADYPVGKIRPLSWLIRSLDYMETELMDKGREGTASDGSMFDSDRTWGQVTRLENYKFHFERLRMISKELTMQNFTYGGKLSARAIELLERLTRYWTIYLHHLNNDEDFVRDDGKQNVGLFRNTYDLLKSLYEYARIVGQPGLLRHEAEFNAYAILQHEDIKLALSQRAQLKGATISPEVHLALTVLTCRETGNYALFFRVLRRAPYLLACLMTKYVKEMRELALNRMFTAWKVGSPHFKLMRFPASEFMSWLGMASEAEVSELAASREWVELDPESFVIVRHAASRQRQTIKPAEESTDTAKKKSAIAADLLRHFPYIPLIESKVHGIRFREITRGLKGCLRLSVKKSLPLSMEPGLRDARPRQVRAKQPAAVIAPAHLYGGFKQVHAQDVQSQGAVGRGLRPTVLPQRCVTDDFNGFLADCKALPYKLAIATIRYRRRPEDGLKSRAMSQISMAGVTVCRAGEAVRPQRPTSSPIICPQAPRADVRPRAIGEIAKITSFRADLRGPAEATSTKQGSEAKMAPSSGPAMQIGEREEAPRGRGEKHAFSSSVAAVLEDPPRVETPQHCANVEGLQKQAFRIMCRTWSRIRKLDSLGRWKQVLKDALTREMSEADRFQRGLMSLISASTMQLPMWTRDDQEDGRDPYRWLTCQNLHVDIAQVIGSTLLRRHEDCLRPPSECPPDFLTPIVIKFKLLVHAAEGDLFATHLLRCLGMGTAGPVTAHKNQKGQVADVAEQATSSSLLNQHLQWQFYLKASKVKKAALLLRLESCTSDGLQEAKVANGALYLLPEIHDLAHSPEYWDTHAHRLRRYLGSITPSAPLALLAGPNTAAILHQMGSRLTERVADLLHLDVEDSRNRTPRAGGRAWDIFLVDEEPSSSSVSRALSYIAQYCPLTQTCTKLSLTSYVKSKLGTAVSQRLQGGEELDPEQTVRLLNESISKLTSELCYERTEGVMWPSIEAEHGAQVHCNSSSTLPSGRASAASMTTACHDVDRLLKVESLLQSVYLPPVHLHARRPTICWLERYLQVDYVEQSCGWALRPSAAVMQYVKELISLSDQTQQSDTKLVSMRLWPTIFMAVIMDRLHALCKNSGVASDFECISVFDEETELRTVSANPPDMASMDEALSQLFIQQCSMTPLQKRTRAVRRTYAQAFACEDDHQGAALFSSERLEGGTSIESPGPTTPCDLKRNRAANQDALPPTDVGGFIECPALADLLSALEQEQEAWSGSLEMAQGVTV